VSDILEINDSDQLEDLRVAWKQLLSQTAQASFFQTLDWLRCYWRHYGTPANQPPQRLRVIIVHHGGQPAGIVPLTVICERTRVGQVRVLTYPLHDWGWIYGPIGPDPAQTLAAALEHIAATRRDWDLLDLRWVNDDCADCGGTTQAMQAAGFAAQRGVWKQTAHVATTAGWDAWFASKTSKWRNNIRRCEKRVAELGDVELVRYRPRGAEHGEDDPRWDLYDAAVEVARQSWQASATDGTTICHDSVAEFFRETYALAVKNGMMDLCLLKAGGQPIAFGYNYFHDGCVSGIRFGFDQQHAKAGAGNAMYLHMLRDSFARGDRLFDMGIGSLEIKEAWLTGTANSYRFTHYPLASPRSQLLRLKHWWDRRTLARCASKGEAGEGSESAAGVQA
jgi:CelD/BcsL family acetyltransferase involved in cellulose biosynthesis